MLPKRNKGPPASLGEKRWDWLHSVAIWLEMSYKILTHWTWLSCKKLSLRKEVFVTESLTPPALTRHGYITFSKSCKDRMILSSWKQWEDIFMKPALIIMTCNFARHRRGSAAAPADNSLAFIMLFILDELELIQWSGSVSAKQLSLTLAPWFEACKQQDLLTSLTFSVGCALLKKIRHQHWAGAVMNPQVSVPNCISLILNMQIRI